MIRHAHRQHPVHRDDPGRQTRENDRQPLALALHRLLTMRGLLAGPPQTFRHVVKGVHEKAHLIPRREWQPSPEIAFAHCTGSRDEILHRTHQTLRRKDGAVNGGEHGEQQNQRQGEPEAVFERLAHRRQIAVL